MKNLVAAPQRFKTEIASLELSCGDSEAGGKYLDSNRVLGFDSAKLIETLGAAYERAQREGLVIQIEIEVSNGYDGDIDIDAVTIYGYRDESEAEVDARVQAARLQFEAQQRVAAANTAAFERAEYDRLKAKFERQ